MQRDFISIKYQIEFETPFHCGTGLRRDLLDRSVCRDANDYVYIPGSTLKGVFRERCEQIARIAGLCVVSPHDVRSAIASFGGDISIVDRIFGSRYRPSSVYFDDLIMISEDQKFFDFNRESHESSKRYIHLQTETRTQTSISRLLGTAREENLFQSEFGHSQLRFEGEIYGHLEGFHIGENAWSYSLLLLVAGISANDRIGANKSTGMGKYACQIRKIRVNDTVVEVKNLLATLSELRSYPTIQENTL